MNTSDRHSGPRIWLQYGFSAVVAGSLWVIVYESNLLFLGCIIIGLYAALFILHALCVKSWAINMVVVIIFWSSPPLILGQDFMHFTMPNIIEHLATIAIHLLFQSGLVFIFWSLRKLCSSYDEAGGDCLNRHSRAGL